MLSREFTSSNGGSDSDEPSYESGASKSIRTSHKAERTQGNTQQTNQAARASKPDSITRVSNLVVKQNQPAVETDNALQVDEDILCALE